jgi:hypothetical protein
LDHATADVHLQHDDTTVSQYSKSCMDFRLPTFNVQLINSTDNISLDPSLQQEPIFRVVVSQLILLLLRQIQVRRHLVSFPVRADARKTIQHSRDHCQAGERDADAVPCLIPWRIRIEEREDGDDAANVTESDLPSRCDGPSCMAADVHVEPTHHERHGAVASHGHQEQSGILDVAVVLDRDEDCKR